MYMYSTCTVHITWHLGMFTINHMSIKSAISCIMFIHVHTCTYIYIHTSTCTYMYMLSLSLCLSLFLSVCLSLSFYSSSSFSDVLQSGLQESPLMLPSSDLHDSVLCSEIANLSFTGQNQIILGTYGKVMMSLNMNL